MNGRDDLSGKNESNDFLFVAILDDHMIDPPGSGYLHPASMFFTSPLNNYTLDTINSRDQTLPIIRLPPSLPLQLPLFHFRAHPGTNQPP